MNLTEQTNDEAIYDIPSCKDCKSFSSIRDIKGSTLSFHNINYTIMTRTRFKTQERVILNDISGIFKPGMNGILGPTGGGKSSLLNVLAGRKDPVGLTGLLLQDGKQVPKAFNRCSGYVVQDDIVMGTLTVRENLMFSANLRLPTSMNYNDKKHRVDETIEELGLTKCADSKVGTEFIRGVSGGERKRTNIGMELIIAPSVLFLDEPTTGLDASTANAVMNVLSKLAMHGHTIIFSIHQPRFSIFKLIDLLMLLGDGRTIYFGPAQDGLEYFSTLGYICEEHNNPPDFFLDIINGDNPAVKRLQIDSNDNSKQKLNDEEAEKDIEIEIVGKNYVSLTTRLNQSFLKSNWSRRLQDELALINNKFQNDFDNDSIMRLKCQYATSPLVQIKHLAKRSLLNLLRNPQSLLIQTSVVSILALIIGLIFLQQNQKLLDVNIAVSNRIGAMFFITVNQMFSNISAVELFIKERVIFIHENGSGFYRVSAYFFAKIFCDLIPMRIIPMTCFSLLVYFMIGYEITPEQFFFFYFIIFLTNMSAAAIGFSIGSTVKILAVANLLINLVLIPMMLFGGFLANVNSIGEWLNWLQYLSVVRYSLNAQLINQFKQTTFRVTSDNLTYTFTSEMALQKIGESMNIYYESQWDLWKNVLALIIIIFFFMSLTYIQLRRIPKLK